jgi:hypothetical protein
LLIKASIKCISCKKAYPYEEIDRHELNCGKCHLCATKLSPAVSVMQHHVNECPKVEIPCANCLRTFKRGKFRGHKCERALTQEEIDKRNDENVLLQKAKQDNLLEDALPVKKGKIYDDKPLNVAEYEQHWKKKTKGCYMLGLGRWFRVCRQNLGKDIEAKTKLFQVLMMIAMSITCTALTIYIISICDESYTLLPFIGFGLELCGGLLCSLIGYGILASSWEGYFKRGCLKTVHCLTLILLSVIIPHGDFLLHLGYYQRGYQKKGQEEPFPDGFELQKDLKDYQGYLSSSGRGGFNTFFVLGYIRCLFSLIRMVLTISFFSSTGFYLYYDEMRMFPIIMAMFISYASFNFLMLLKFLFENLTLPRCLCLEEICRKRKAKKRLYHEQQSLIEDDGEIL